LNALFPHFFHLKNLKSLQYNYTIITTKTMMMMMVMIIIIITPKKKIKMGKQMNE